MDYVIYSLTWGIIIGIILSIDAFLMSLLYGTSLKSKRETYIVSVFVGLAHFIMPFLGYLIANLTLARLEVAPEKFASFIFLIIGLMMIFKEDEVNNKNKLSHLVGKLLFAFSVSLDSFMIGISFKMLDINIVIAAICFAIISFILTFISLSIGRLAEQLLRLKLNLIAGIIMIILAILTFL